MPIPNDITTGIPTTARAAAMVRLHKEGRYDAYVKLKDAFIRDGINATEAWRFALADFPPKDGRPHEVANLPKPQIHDHVFEVEEDDEPCLDGADWVDDAPSAADVSADSSGVSEDQGRVIDSGSGEGSADIGDVRGTGVDGIGFVETENGSTVLVDDRESTSPDGSVQPAKRGPGRPKNTKNPVGHMAAPVKPLRGPTKKDQERKRLGEEAAYKDLWATVPKGKVASMKAEAFWIMESIDEDFANMTTDEVPSRKALAQLKKIKEGGAKAFQDFNTTIYSKFLPARPDNEEDGGAGGGDGEYVAAFQQFEQSFFSSDNPELPDDVEDEEGDPPDLEPHDADDDTP